MLNKKCKLYAIADQETCHRHNMDIHDLIKIFLNCGVEVLQYRNKIDKEEVVEKHVQEILKIIPESMIVVINDYSGIAARYHTWLHLGQTDANVNRHTPFGRSTHSPDEIKKALAESPAPEYIGFGAMFPGKTKPEISPQADKLEEVLKIWTRDIVLIGGITCENIELLPGGENLYYAVISDFFSQGNKYPQIENRVKLLCRKTIY